MSRYQTAEMKPSAKQIKFNPREAELAGLLAQGKSRMQMAELLKISCRTVNFHLKNMARKFEILGRY